MQPDFCRNSRAIQTPTDHAAIANDVCILGSDSCHMVSSMQDGRSRCDWLPSESCVLEVNNQSVKQWLFESLYI